MASPAVVTLLAVLGTAVSAQPNLDACGQFRNGSVELPNGVLLPCVSLGTGDSVNQTRINLEQALAVGFQGVDTALTYFDQAGVAEAIADEIGRHPRSEIIITTKVPGGGAGVDNYKSTMFDAKENLRLLKVDYVDLLLVHWSPLVGCECASIREQWRAMEVSYRYVVDSASRVAPDNPLQLGSSPTCPQPISQTVRQRPNLC
jgi:hypothetical protein